MARRRSDSWTTEGRSPACFINRPAARASSTPCSLRGTSVQPVKRFSRFQVLSPWRRRISVPGEWGLTVAIDLGRHVHYVRELVRVETCPAHQRAVAYGPLDVLLHVLRVDASAVEDAHLARSERVHHLPDPSADQP